MNQKFRLFFTIFLLIATPLFVWAVLTQKIELRKHATANSTLTLSPQTSTLTVGQETNIIVQFSTDNIAVSSVAMRLTFPVSNNDLEVVSITPNSDLIGAGWSFPVKIFSTQNNITTIDVAALNISTTGYLNTSKVPFVTIALKANQNFDAKAVTFDTTETKMLKKSDSSNIIGTLNNGYYSAGTGLTGSPTITLTPTNSNTPTGTITQTLTPTSSQSPTPTLTITPTPTLVPGQQQMTFRVKLAGVSDDSAEGAQIGVKFNIRNGSILQLSAPLTLTHVGDGIYSTTITVANPFAAGTQFRVKIKGEKHVGIEFCSQSGQTIPCADETYITVPATVPTNYVFDFTGIPLPPGDLSIQDGQANGADLDKLTPLMSKLCADLTIAEKLIGDVDYNGCVNVRDVFLILQTLETRYDE